MSKTNILLPRTEFKDLIVDPAEFNKLATGGIGDSLAGHGLESKKKYIEINGQRWERVYCVSCSRPNGGLAFNLSCIVWQCNECFQRYGELPMPRIPDELVEGKVN